MSKADGRRVKRVGFLAELLRVKTPTKWTPPKELEPTPRRQDCICKPNDPVWVEALKRKCEQYKHRLGAGKDLDFLETMYKLLLIETVLREGYANIFDCRKAFCKEMETDIDFQTATHAEKIVHVYCYNGGKGAVSPDGDFLTS